ncbi:MAG: GNAT family N-acetyltransferase [Protaetiibacter sp.]
MSVFLRPRPITPNDRVSTFSCGEQSLDDWLNLRAIKNEKGGNSRTFITTERDSGPIAGYYCLSAHSVAREEMPGSLRRKAPDPIPVILIGRLAVDSRFKGQGLGHSLLADALAKGLEAAKFVGSRAFLVDALGEKAVAFYQKFGFQLMPESTRALYVTMADARATVATLSEG